MIRNALCMSVLLFTIASALSSHGAVPQRLQAGDDTEQLKYRLLEHSLASHTESLSGPINRIFD